MKEDFTEEAKELVKGVRMAVTLESAIEYAEVCLRLEYKRGHLNAIQEHTTALEELNTNAQKL